MTSPPAAPSPANTIYLDDMGELIASIPSMIGFPPENSLVLITFHIDERIQLGATMRMDLPEEGHAPDLVGQLCLTAVANNADVAVPVIVGGSADPPELPYRWLMDFVAQELDDVDIPIVHAIWVPAIEFGETWWCYVDEECTGQVRDPQCSALAALHTYAGLVRYASRAEMAAHLAPDREDRVAHVAQLLAEQSGKPAGAAAVEQWAQVSAAIDATADTVPDLPDEQIARLAAALSDPLVRDNCLPLPLTDRGDAAELLWTALIRVVPAPERASPAILLAIHAYLRGEGVLANLAVEVALDADPDHDLARLVRDALDRGLPPTVLRSMIEESVSSAERILAAEADR
ncbi:MAG TPA: DUF4192 domain-containing protein [Actinophytocola sp.]|jgi:hypothetical protein|nr:DUF4192 domain-containing protein [Actinophytocola sp.]